MFRPFFVPQLLFLENPAAFFLNLLTTSVAPFGFLKALPEKISVVFALSSFYLFIYFFASFCNTFKKSSSSDSSIFLTLRVSDPKRIFLADIKIFDI